jgi:hypothetical protein
MKKCKKMPKKYYNSSDDESNSSHSNSRSPSPSPSPSHSPSSGSSSPSRSPSPKKKTTKRSKTSYMYFCDSERKKIAKEHPDWKLGDVSKELGKRWKDLSDRKKKKFENMAGK